MKPEEINKQAEIAREWHTPVARNGVHINWSVLNGMLSALIAANDIIRSQEKKIAEQGKLLLNAQAALNSTFRVMNTDIRGAMYAPDYDESYEIYLTIKKYLALQHNEDNND